MKAYKDFIVSPIGERYNNSTKVGDKNLILNTEVFNHQYVNRLAKVIATPLLFQSPINVGDEVIVHHNVFRRWHDVKGREKNSRSYWKEDKYLISKYQIYLYKGDDWKATTGNSFIKPIESSNDFSFNNEKELVGFTPNSEYEFIINGEKLYRVLNKFITIKYEYQGNEEEYNPSWAQSG